MNRSRASVPTGAGWRGWVWALGALALGAGLLSNGWAQATATVSIANVSVPEGQVISVKMSVSGIVGAGLSDFQGRLNFDADVARVTQLNGLNGYTVFASKLDAPGEARFVVAKTGEPFLQEGEVLEFVFVAVGQVNDSTSLELTLTTFNDKNGVPIPHTITNGRLTIVPQQPLRANFTFSPQAPVVNEPIQFTDTTPAPPAGELVAWSWDFGDGATSNERNPTHAYAEPGTYSVRLNVMDSFGQTDEITKQVTVTNPAPTGKVVVHTFPQPATTRVTFVYQLPRDTTRARLVVFSALGKRVLQQDLDVNRGQFEWNLLDEDGEPVPNGAYFYQIVARSESGAVTGRSPVGKLIVQR